MATIRYLQAFRNRGEYSLIESLCYELGTPMAEVAATWNTQYNFTKCRRNRHAWDIVESKSIGTVPVALIGLLVDKRAVRRKFNCDVWSVYREDGTLYPTVENYGSGHTEAFCKPRYNGLVINIRAFSKKHQARMSEVLACVDYAQSINLPVYVIKNGKLSKYVG